MARREFEVTTEWQVASRRAALFTIIAEPITAGANKILFNDAPTDVYAEQLTRGNKGEQIFQPLDVTTYVKATTPGYKLAVED